MLPQNPAIVRALALGGTLAACLLMGLHISEWWFYVSDDTFISLRYADRLLAGQGLTWTEGPPVEGYSNLLWVLLVAAFGACGVDLFVASRILGVACSMGVIAVLGLHFKENSPVGAWVAGLGIAASSTMALWAVGGLEQPLLCLLMAWAFVGLSRGLRGSSLDLSPDPLTVFGPAVALSLACLTRPDAPVLVAGITLGWFLAAGQDRVAFRSAVVLGGLPFVTTMGQLLFRLVYYNDVVPNTAHVKVRPSEAHTDAGAIWTVQALDNHGWLLGLAALSLLFWPRGEPERGRLRLALPVIGAWLAWTVWIGGDIFPAFRHLAPLVVVFAWLAGSGAVGLAQRWAPGGWVVALVAPIALGLMTADQWKHPSIARAHNEGWVIEALDVGATLGRAFPSPRPLLAVSTAGAVPYTSRLPALDMLGLNDAHIARQGSSGSGWVGHEVGDGDYVFAKAPDLILFRGPRGAREPSFPSEKELAARPDFNDTYALGRFETPAPGSIEFRPWIRRAGAAGVQSGEAGARVPGWLLTEGGGVARPDSSGRLKLHLGPGEVAGLDPVPLSAGTWTASPVAGVEVSLVGPGVQTVPGGWLVEAGAHAQLTVTATGTATTVDAISFERL